MCHDHFQTILYSLASDKAKLRWLLAMNYLNYKETAAVCRVGWYELQNVQLEVRFCFGIADVHWYVVTRVGGEPEAAVLHWPERGSLHSL